MGIRNSVLVNLVICAYLFAMLPVYSNTDVWRVQQITNDDGLSNSAVNSIFMDSRGFMWFGTWDGLNQYDGKSMMNYYPEGLTPQRISNNIIWDILEDQSNGLWIVTEKGINRYDYEHQYFSSWFDDVNQFLLKENSLKATIGPDGQLWLAIYGEGLFRFSYESHQFLQIDFNPVEKKLSSNITGIFSANGITYLLHESWIISQIDASGSLIRHHAIEHIYQEELPKPELFWMFSTPGEALAAYSCLDGSLLMVNMDTGETNRIFDPGHTSIITALFAVKEDGKLLLGTDDGNILEYNINGPGKFVSILDKLHGLEEKKVKIRSIYQSSDLLWIGTDGEGIYQANTQSKSFYNIERGSADERRINHKIVRAVYEDKQGNIWVGTRGNGLNKIPANGGPTVYFTTNNGLSNDAVLSIQEDHAGNLWIGVDGPGVDVLNPVTGKILHLPTHLRGGENIDFASVYTICVDVFGTIWLGTSGYGLLGFTITQNGDDFTLEDIHHLAGKGHVNDLRGNIVFAVTEERPNILWVGTRMAGLHRYNTLTREVQYFGQAAVPGRGLSNPDVLSLMIGSDRTLWIGTSGGLNSLKLNQPEPHFNYFSVSDGLPNHTIHAVLEDHHGDIWISTNKGLSRFLRTQDRFINYNSGDGLINNEYTDGAAFHNKVTGRFYFGGINGIDWFYPDQISISNEHPKVILSSFSLFNKVVVAGDESGILTKSIHSTKEIRLKHNQNFFGVEYTTLNYHNAAKNNFAYKLENFNPDWVDAGSQRLVNFTNVPFGSYKLLLRATNEDGFWSDQVTSIRIIITPPFWLTYTAFVVYTLVFFLLGYLVYRYQTRKIRRNQAAELEKLNRQKETELNNYKFEFFTNLAHEFRTPLTLIFASAATLIDKMVVDRPEQPYLKNIYTNARRMQHMIDELLAFQKLDSGREKLNFKTGDLVGFAAGITDVFSHFANEKELEITFEPEIPSLIVPFDAEKIERILLNLLSNAIKYTAAGGAITVKLKTIEDFVVFIVKDTGIGIAPEILSNIFERYFHHTPQQAGQAAVQKSSGIGLAYTQSLINLHKGKVEVVSKPGEGSTFTVFLPIINRNIDYGPDKMDPIRHKERLKESIAEEYFQQQDFDDESTYKVNSTLTRASKYRILIVEDDFQLLQLLQNLLAEYYDVVTAENGQTALEYLKQKRIDLVVSDVMMPVMDGLTLCKTIKSELVTSHIPVILLTARAGNEPLIEGLETGADGYITKPFHPKHLQLSIEKLLTTRQLLTAGIRQNIESRSESMEQHLSQRDRKLLDKTFAFLKDNYFSEQLNADQLADQLALSKAQLYRKIKAITGLTPHGLIKNYRLNKAREMIIEGKYNITDIVFMVGFNNRTYFYRSFRELFGEAPGELNKTARPKQSE